MEKLEELQFAKEDLRTLCFRETQPVTMEALC